MKLALWSDWHLGQTKDKTIVRAFGEMKEHKPDVLVAAGDYNGGWYGAKATHTVFMRMREVIPDIPCVGVLGNHEHWVRGRKARFTGDHLSRSWGRPSYDAWMINYRSILDTLNKFNVHFLDLAGPFRLPSFPGIALAGHTLWYQKEDPPTNDLYWMPHSVEGNTHAYMRSQAYKQLFDSLDKLTDEDKTRVFISHFPVINVKGDHEFEQFSGSVVLGESLQETFGFKKFLCGHAHQRHEGPVRYEAGSDYGKPRFQIIEV